MQKVEIKMKVKQVNTETLKDWLLTLTVNDFRSSMEKGSQHELACTMRVDIERFGNAEEIKPTIIKYGDLFLVDVHGGELTIAKHTKRKFNVRSRSNTTRLVSCKPIVSYLIEDTQTVYGSYVNGCFAIPQRFYI